MAHEVRLDNPRAVVGAGLCVGCGSCAARADVPAISMHMDRYGERKPAGTQRRLALADAAFARTCPSGDRTADEDALARRRFGTAPNMHPAVGRWREAYVGHAVDSALRSSASSGGLGTWVALALLRSGKVDGVLHVAPRAPHDADGPLFDYRISRSPDEVRGGARSRYYPVHMADVLRTVARTPGRYAVVGLPCFIKAVQLLREEDPVFRERICHTVGLFCGHMKSARLIESFAWQMGVAPHELAAADFRLKAEGRPASHYVAGVESSDGRRVERAWERLAEGDWGAGFFQNPACDCCDDVMAETADVSLGDAWQPPYQHEALGTNVVVLRSAAMAGLFEAARHSGELALEPVGAEFLARTQAAGLRQRREGLAFRLSRLPPALRPTKRVRPDPLAAAAPRRRLYRLRAAITRWSRRLYAWTRPLGLQRFYVAWARAAMHVYHGAAYGRGRMGAWLQRIGLAQARE
jgi:coenzyme F420-reducing hydrogenase beta subunit